MFIPTTPGDAQRYIRRLREAVGPGFQVPIQEQVLRAPRRP